MFFSQPLILRFSLKIEAVGEPLAVHVIKVYTGVGIEETPGLGETNAALKSPLLRLDPQRSGLEADCSVGNFAKV